jgi:DNA polymerase elongation subunit (family B)
MEWAEVFQKVSNLRPPVDSLEHEYQVLQWVGYDKGGMNAAWKNGDSYQTYLEDNNQYTIALSCCNAAGNSCVVETPYNPWFSIRIDSLPGIRAKKFDAKKFVDYFITHEYGLKSTNQGIYNLKKRSGYFVPRTYSALNPEYDFTDTCQVPKYVQIKFESAVIGQEINLRQDITEGFTGVDPELFEFLDITFKTKSSARACVDFLRKRFPGIKIYEANLEDTMRFAHRQNVKMAGWFKIEPDAHDDVSKDNKTRTQLHLLVDDWLNLKGIDKTAVAPFIECSIDLECHSGVQGKFPNPEKATDKIIQIAIYITIVNRPDARMKILLNLGPCGKLADDEYLVRCDTEKELLVRFADLLVACDPDTIHAYNGFGFDFNYLWVRACRCEVQDKYRNLGRFKCLKGRLYEKEMKTGAYGANSWKFITMPGRFVYDPMVHVRRSYKLTSYSLNDVTRHFLSVELGQDPLSFEKGSPYVRVKHKKHGYVVGQSIHFDEVRLPDLTERNGERVYTLGGWSYGDFHTPLHPIVEVPDSDSYIIKMPSPCTKTDEGGGSEITVFESKHDVSFNDMNDAFKAGDGEIMAKVGRYCIQDTILPQKVLEQQCVLLNLIEMSKVTWVPIDYLITRGQSVKVFSMISRVAYRRGVAVIAVERSFAKDDVEKEDLGSKNIPEGPKEKYVGGLVLEAKSGFYGEDPVEVPDFASLYPSTMIDYCLGYLSMIKNKKYLNMPGVKYLKVKTSETTTYVHASVPGRLTIIGEILSDLLDSRKAEKKKMNAAKDPLTESIHNGAQLALKISANSIYGFCGTSDDKAMIKGGRPIAISTTALGRDATSRTEKFYENQDNFVEIKKCVDYFPADYIYVCKTAKGYWVHMTAADLMKHFGVEDHDAWTNGSIKVKEDPLLVYGTKKEASITGFSKMSDPTVFGGETLFKVHLSNGEQFHMQRYGPSLKSEHGKIVIYGDTDSVFVCIDTSHLADRRTKVVYGQVASAYVASKATDMLRKLNDLVPYDQQRQLLEYEKTYAFFILFSKKRYGGIMCEFSPYKWKNDNKGTANKRRDFTVGTKEVYSGMFKALFNFNKTSQEEMIDDMFEVVNNALTDLINGRMPMDKLLVSKSLNDEYRIRRKTERASDIKKGKLTFGKHNIFVDDLVELKPGTKSIEDDNLLNWKVEEKIVLKNQTFNPFKLRIKKGKQELVVGYDKIFARGVKVLKYDYIIDSKASDEEVADVTQSHVLLGRKMALRDPNSAPKAGDRMYMVFTMTKNPKAKQWERVEDPAYVRDTRNNSKIDPIYYFKKQFRKPLSQILDTVRPGSAQKLFDAAELAFGLHQRKQSSIGLWLEDDSGTKLSKSDNEIVIDIRRQPIQKAKPRRKALVNSQNLGQMFLSNSGSNSMSASDMLERLAAEAREARRAQPQAQEPPKRKSPPPRKPPTRKKKKKKKAVPKGQRSIGSFFSVAEKNKE